jgi:hypothetical protein
MEPQGAVGGIGWGIKERDLLRSAWSRDDRGWQILRTLNRDGAGGSLGGWRPRLALISEEDRKRN